MSSVQCRIPVECKQSLENTTTLQCLLLQLIFIDHQRALDTGAIHGTIWKVAIGKVFTYDNESERERECVCVSLLGRVRFCQHRVVGIPVSVLVICWSLCWSSTVGTSCTIKKPLRSGTANTTKSTLVRPSLRCNSKRSSCSIRING
jgi:hypothetical protein